MTQRAELIINNVPEYAMEHPLWVVRLDEYNKDQAWFYGAWDTDEEASDIVNRDDGSMIVHNPNCNKGIEENEHKHGITKGNSILFSDNNSSNICEPL